MTRRDAALLTLTLAGLWCLFNATTMLIAFAAPRESVMVPDSSMQRLFSVLPIAILSCAGFALLQSRRKFSTWIFSANPSHDATAQVDAGDMRLLAVRVVGFLLLAQLLRSLQSISTAAILAIGTALCFFRAGAVVRMLFAAGPGEGKSPRYREGLAFVLALLGAYYVLSNLGDAIEAIAGRAWLNAAASLAIVIAGVIFIVRRRELATA